MIVAQLLLGCRKCQEDQIIEAPVVGVSNAPMVEFVSLVGGAAIEGAVECVDHAGHGSEDGLLKAELPSAPY